MAEPSNTSLQTFLSQIHPVPTHILEEYLGYWKPYQVPKKTIMTAPGETERYMYFVQAGIQKSYYQELNKQHIIAFTYSPSITGIPDSFFTQTPARYYLETLTESHFLRISFEQHQAQMQAHREIETLFRKGTEGVLVGVLQRQYELMAMDISTRFKTFVNRSGHLLNTVPHKDLASYLRIAPSNFSKLLNNFSL